MDSTTQPNPTPRPVPRPSSGPSEEDKDLQEDIVAESIQFSKDLTYNLDILANQNIREQIEKVQDFSKPMLATAGMVATSITDQDHWPYTRRFRGITTSCYPNVYDRSAGFRPMQDACYASAAISTGIANLTGTDGFQCGAPIHKSSLGVGGSVKPDTPSTTIEAFTTPGVFGESAKYVRNDVRDPNSGSSTYPHSVSIAGSGMYARVPYGSVGGKTAYPVTCFQPSCRTIFPCHNQQQATEFDLNILRI